MGLRGHKGIPDFSMVTLDMMEIWWVPPPPIPLTQWPCWSIYSKYLEDLQSPYRDAIQAYRPFKALHNYINIWVASGRWTKNI